MIGASFFLQNLAVNDATKKFEIWDTNSLAVLQRPCYFIISHCEADKRGKINDYVDYSFLLNLNDKCIIESQHDTPMRGIEEVSTSNNDAVPLSELRKRRTPLSEAQSKKPPQRQLKKRYRTRRASQLRCTILAFVELVNQYQEAIPTETWEILNGTVFSPMMCYFRDALLKEANCRKTEIDIEIIIKDFDTDRMLWSFSSLQLDLTVEFVTVLFHLPTEGLKIVPVSQSDDRKEQAANLFKNCKETKGSSRTNIKNLLTSEVNTEKRLHRLC
ncbi:hypothetical protein LguiA_034306 [Lonicera macranthoides]